ncbi:MAG TPA: universal stress protein [Spongiibacteraceae bacterium]|nr:universal stress protein [Spongiibacteraceae bacterium]
MAAYAKILCPVDGSKTSNRGMREAIRIARELNAQILFLNVVDYSAFLVYPAGIDDWSDAWHREGKKIVAKAHRAAQKKSVFAEEKAIEIRKGRVASAIVAEAKKNKADLIVMGTHGRRGIGGFLLGSDAATVVAASAIPVLLVK